VLGASFNTPEQNAAFAQKLGLKFPLLSDSGRATALAYGACQDLRAQHPERKSFLIDEQGRIERVYDRVDPRDHPARVLADVLGA
jgi:peroxiredoxin Q/BCP